MKILPAILLSVFLIIGCKGKSETFDAISYEIEKIEIKEGKLDYCINIKNTSARDIVLTDITGDYYSISNGTLFVELYSHDEELAKNCVESYTDAKDYLTLKPDEKKCLEKTVFVNSAYHNNFSSDGKNEKKIYFSDVHFLIGYTEEIINNPTFVDFTYMQRITGIKSRKDFYEMPFEKKIDYLFNDCRYNFHEFEQEAYCKMLTESSGLEIRNTCWQAFDYTQDENKLSVLLTNLLPLAKDRDFYSSGKRDYSLDKTAVVLFDLINFINSPDNPGIMINNEILELQSIIINKSFEVYESGRLEASELLNLIYKSLGSKDYIELVLSYFPESEISDKEKCLLLEKILYKK